MKYRVIVLLLALSLGLTSCGFEGDPMLDDLWTRNVNPGFADIYNIGNEDYHYNEGWFNTIIVGSVVDNSQIRDDGSIRIVSLADADAVNNSIYYSTDQSSLVYKDNGGVVNDLY